MPPAASRRGPRSAVLTSLPLEILYYFGGWYDVVFWVILFLVFIYKGFELPYTTSTFGMEFSFVFLYLLIEPARLFLGSKGNLTEDAVCLFMSCGLALPIVFMHAYFIILQTYVLRIEQFINAVALAFVVLQFLCSILVGTAFIRS